MDEETRETLRGQIDRFVKRSELPQITSLSVVTIWRLRREGKFPEPVALTPGRLAWRLSDITRWMDAQKPAGRPA